MQGSLGWPFYRLAAETVWRKNQLSYRGYSDGWSFKNYPVEVCRGSL